MEEIKHTLEGFYGLVRMHEGDFDRLMKVMRFRRICFYAWLSIAIPFFTVLLSPLIYSLYRFGYLWSVPEQEPMRVVFHYIVAIVIGVIGVVMTVGLYVKIDPDSKFYEWCTEPPSEKRVSYQILVKIAKHKDSWKFSTDDKESHKWADRSFSQEQVLETANVPPRIIARYRELMTNVENQYKTWSITTPYFDRYTRKRKLIERIFLPKRSYALLLMLEDNSIYLVGTWDPNDVIPAPIDIEKTRKLEV